MAPLTPSTGAFGLVFGVATAVALSGGAVLTVLQSGCDDPGSYQFRDGVVELAGGCLQPDDFPVTSEGPENPPRPLDRINPAQVP